MIGERIKEACSISGVSLKKACEVSGLKYNTVYNQIEKNREIPFSTVQLLATALGIPLSYFASGLIDTNESNGENRWDRAELANAERARCTRAGFEVTTDNILDWYHQESGVLRNWEWFADQIDLYHKIDPTDRIMRPISIGKRSLTAERLMLSGNKDFYQIVGGFEQRVLDRAMWTHKEVESIPYVVTDEVIDVLIKGQRVNGGYRKVTMSLTDPDGTPITAVFSKLTWLNSS